MAGTGFGARVHVPALRAAGFTVAALVGRDPERTARRADRVGVPLALTSFPDALELRSVVAVTVATPPGAHCSLVREAIAAGKHVLCEKPFALDTAEAEAMVGSATAAGVTNLVGHEFRWATDRAVAGRAIASGAIGEPRLATLVQHVPLIADPGARMPEWWFDPAAGGGWLGASGSHVVDQVRVWLGEIEWVSGGLSLVSARPANVAEDSFTIRAGLASGAEALLHQTAGAWGPAVGITRVAGSSGSVWLDGGDAWLADASGERRLTVPPELQLPKAPAESDEPAQRFTHLELGPYVRLCEALRAGVEGRPVSAAVPLPTFADGLAEMRVLDAVRASATRDGERIRV